MVEQEKRARGWHQRYLGARVNCESVPRLPAGAVAWVLDDPRPTSSRNQKRLEGVTQVLDGIVVSKVLQ